MADEQTNYVRIILNGRQLELITEALDSHKYWQLSDMKYRDSGNVIEPGTDDKDKLVELKEVEALEEFLDPACNLDRSRHQCLNVLPVNSYRFFVSWDIDIDVATAFHAAVEARKAQVAKGSIANCFHVFDRATGTAEFVDLNELDQPDPVAEVDGESRIIEVLRQAQNAICEGHKDLAVVERLELLVSALIAAASTTAP